MEEADRTVIMSEMEDEDTDLEYEVEEENDDDRSQFSQDIRLEMALKQIRELESELSEFQQSSYELEQELEKELMAMEDKTKQYEQKVAEKSKETDEWKKKYLELEKEYNNVNSTYEDKFRNYKTELNSVRSKLVNIEIMNDNIEQNERILSINLNDLESRYNDSLEKIALLESEVSFKDELLSKEKLKAQNAENTLSEKVKSLEEEIVSLKANSSHFYGSSTKIFRQPSNSTGKISMHQTPETSFQSTNSGYANRIPQSNSIKQLHSMIEQTKNMENQVESIRNTIRPSKLRKVSGKTVHAQPVDSTFDSSIDNSGVDSMMNTTYFSALSKSPTNESLNHSKSKKYPKKHNLQKPPIQPLGFASEYNGSNEEEKPEEFGTHFKELSTIKSVSKESKTMHSQIPNSAIKKISSTVHQLESIPGSPSKPLKKDNKKIHDKDSPKRVKKKNGLLPSLRRFNLN